MAKVYYSLYDRLLSTESLSRAFRKVNANKGKLGHRRLRQLGYKGEFKHIKMNSWRNSASPLANMALSNDYLRELGLFDLGRVRTAATASN